VFEHIFRPQSSFHLWQAASLHDACRRASPSLYRRCLMIVSHNSSSGWLCTMNMRGVCIYIDVTVTVPCMIQQQSCRLNVTCPNGHNGRLHFEPDLQGYESVRFKIIAIYIIQLAAVVITSVSSSSIRSPSGFFLGSTAADS